ncbi:iron ABC transporter permease [bacterium]|nr:iron ABC transporter permease [bacterium]
MTKNNRVSISLGLGVLFIAVSFLYLNYKVPSMEILQAIRLPRFILTLITGMVLASVGNIYQMLLNNPLAEPYILGTSSGSALFSITAYIMGFTYLMPLFGFLGAVLAMTLVWFIAKTGSGINTVKLILSGIIVSMICSAVISLYIYLFPNQITIIMGTLMGSLNHVFTNLEWYIFLGLVALSLLLLTYLYFLSNSLNIISTGDITAHSLGVDTAKIRKQIFIITSLLIAIVTSYAGIIGFVGLIIPHIVRMICGDNLRNNYFITMLIGGTFLLLCDFLAFHISPFGELPVGIITTLIGSIFFISILRKRN